MKKLLLFILVGIIIAGIYLSSGGNISSSEMMLSESKARDAISKVIGAIDTVGDGAFYDLDIEVDGFKGVVEQPASSFSSKVKEYQVTDDLTLKYGAGSITLDKAGEGKGIINNSLPKDVRDSKKSDKLDKVKVVGTDGLNPILRDGNEYKEWTDDFLFTPQGLNLVEVPGIKLDALKGIKGSEETLRKELLNFIFGDTEGGSTKKYTWDLFKVDRLVALKEINVEALTGVEKNKDVLKLIDPNRVAIYQVDHVNTNNFRNENFKEETIKKFTDDEPSKFLYNLASHLNQVIGGKILIIPHKDTFKINIAGNPLFKLN